jgi:hypothetical protein
MTIRHANTFKAPAALLGGTAIVAMAILGAVFGGGHDDSNVVVSQGSMKTGETTTVTYKGTIAPVVAAPPVKAKPYGG